MCDGSRKEVLKGKCNEYENNVLASYTGVSSYNKVLLDLVVSLGCSHLNELHSENAKYRK